MTHFSKAKVGSEVSKGRRSVKARFPNDKYLRSTVRNEHEYEYGRGKRTEDEGPTETNGKALVSVARTKRERNRLNKW